MAKRRKLLQQGGPRTKPPSSVHKAASRAAKNKSLPKQSAGAAKAKAKAPAKAANPQQQKPIIPFAPDEAILLVGEGDLSFARSLVQHHGCTDLTATVLEKDLAELVAKYPHAAANVEAVEASGDRNRVLFGVDARRMGPLPDRRRRDRVLFNFPHVGGKSTDVNRQVRYNQELLVDFFGRAERLLAPGGSIVVTLFEGEPYTLWNVRDLARHSGLQVERSFVFRPDAYPGYRHARTLGAVISRDGSLGGGWRGEERPARSYVFFRKDEVPKPVSKKRRRAESSSDSESSSDCESNPDPNLEDDDDDHDDNDQVGDDAESGKDS